MLTDTAPEIVTLLGNESKSIRRYAAGALDTMGIGAIEGDLTKLLADPDKNVRVAAAEALAHRGVSSGVEILLRESPRLGSLNALRRPGPWSRMWTMMRSEESGGKRWDMMWTMAGMAGLDLDMSVATPRGAGGKIP